MPDTVAAPDAAAAAAATAAAAAAANTTPWYNGVITDAGEIGHIQNRGWDKLSPVAAATAAVRAHKEAQHYIGVSPDQLLRVPKDATDEAGWNTVYQRLGAPKDAKEYDTAIATVKLPNGQPLDAPLTETVRAIATKNHLSVAQATDVAKSLVGLATNLGSATAATNQAKLAEEKTGLAQNWGAHFEANMVVAKAAAAKLGVTAEAVSALERQVGYKPVMEMFHKIGQAIGEDKFIRDLSSTGSPTLTREQAYSRRQELMADVEWSKSYIAGDVAKNREMQALIRIERG